MHQHRDLLLAVLLAPMMVLVSPLSTISQTSQSTSSSTASAPVVSLPSVSSLAQPVLAAKDIQGLDVFGTDGRQVGKIAKVNVNGGTIKDVEVQSAGFLGFFAKTYLLPAEKLSKKGGRVEVSMTSEQARQFIK